MRREINWEKTSSFPQKTYKLTLDNNLFGTIEQQYDHNLTYVAKFKNCNYQITNLKLADLNAKREQLAEFLDTSFNEYTIKTVATNYIYNKLSKEVFDLNGKTMVTVESNSIFFPNKGKIIVSVDLNAELLISSLFYLRHLESNTVY
jgi:hypothetical protein